MYKNDSWYCIFHVGKKHSIDERSFFTIFSLNETYLENQKQTLKSFQYKKYIT